MLADMLQSATRLGVLVALAGACGCSLNPQPLPPGDTPDGGGFQSADATTPGADSGTSSGGGDARAALDASMDAVPAVPADASDAEASEGASDGAHDGPNDGGSEDGG
jgi:hypothetical protein